MPKKQNAIEPCQELREAMRLLMAARAATYGKVVDLANELMSKELRLQGIQKNLYRCTEDDLKNVLREKPRKVGIDEQAFLLTGLVSEFRRSGSSSEQDWRDLLVFCATRPQVLSALERLNTQLQQEHLACRLIRSLTNMLRCSITTQDDGRLTSYAETACSACDDTDTRGTEKDGDHAPDSGGPSEDYPTAPEEDVELLELRIDRDFDSYTDAELRELTHAIGALLNIRGEVKILRKREGSVKVTLFLKPQQAQELQEGVQQGRLAGFGVSGAESVGTVEVATGSSDRPVAVTNPVAAVTDWREVLAIYYPRVRAWFAHVLTDRAAVDDLTQEVFVRFCDWLAKGKAGVNPWNLIKIMARNVFMEYLRTQKRRKAFLPVEDDTAADQHPQPGESYAREEVSEAIPQLLGHLPTAQRYVLVGRYFLGMTVRELAEAMGTGASTVIKRHNRAVCQLRKLALDRGIAL